MPQPGSLFTRVAEALGLAGPALRAMMPSPVASPPSKFTVANGLLEEASALFDKLRDPVTTLYVACMAAGAMPRVQKREVPARFALHLPQIIELLTQDRRAAMIASSICQQYIDALQALKELDSALANGTIADLSLERSKGKFFYLTRMRNAVEAYPLLVQLFPAPPDRPRQGPARQIIVVADPLFAPFAGRSAPGSLGGGQERVVSEEAFIVLVAAAKPLLEGFKDKMPIMQAAADLASGRVSEIEGTLSLPARQTAETLAHALRNDKAALQMVTKALARHREALSLLEKASPAAYEKLREVLTELAGVPFQLGEHAVLSRIFPAA